MNTKKPFVKLTVWLLIATQLLTPAYAGTTAISSSPVGTSSKSVAPNVIFGLDDSGSMDSEVMQNTSDGAFWYNYDTKSFWDSTNSRFNFNDAGTQSTTMFKYIYLFPNGTNSDARRLDEGSGTNYYNGHHAIPPTKQFAYTRSYAYNPLYYNPYTTYTPWASAYLGSASQTFPAASKTVPRSHPWITSSGGGSVSTTASSTFPIASDIDPSNSTYQAFNWTFLMLPGMTIPAGSYAKKGGTSGLSSVGSDYTVKASDGYYYAAIKYYPATYWVPDSSCTATSTADCMEAPYAVNGTKYLRRYEIRSGNTFPSGRSYDAELQNFANWFTYYRKRKLMLSASMGQVLPQMTSIRGGLVNFNNRSTATMYDFSLSDASKNYQVILGKVYTNPSSGGTPTRETLTYIGEQFKRTGTDAPIQYACQRNAAMIMTDGFAIPNTNISVPSYEESTYGGSKPYQTTYSSTLADIALSYYTNLLRTDLTQGLLSISASDPNQNLHMNTYALTLGAKGVAYQGSDTPDPFETNPTWVNPTASYSPYQVDDLWHATINGRGKMMTATDTTSTAASILKALTEISDTATSQTAVAVSRINLQAGDSTAYMSSYQPKGWYGDLMAYPVDPETGTVTLLNGTTDAKLWSARTQLDAKKANDRIIAMGTSSGLSATPFRAESLASDARALFNVTSTSNDANDVIAWLRGDRSKEGTTYRRRTSVLGDIVYSDPLVVKGAQASYVDSGYDAFMKAQTSRRRVVYQGANDGMLHAFDASNGNELWAYIPYSVASKLKKLASPDYQHDFYVDGSPSAGDIQDSSGTWKTIVVSGLRAGGKGFFALDVTNPDMGNETALANSVIWEFPNANTPESTKNNIGLSFGKPVIAKLKNHGWVVLLTSGYNNDSGDGKGHLFVVNASNGDLIKDIATSEGSKTSPSGLAQISAFASNAATDATIDTVYGGDLNGNLWRFNLTAPTSGDPTSTNGWTAVKLAKATDSSGNAQPITTVPELATVATPAGYKRMIFFGTGKLFADEDLTVTQTQSFYAIADNNPSNTSLDAITRTGLSPAKVTIEGTDRRLTGASPDYKTLMGWYFDLPKGEVVTIDSVALLGTINFVTNLPSSSACNSRSYLYSVKQANASELTGVVGGRFLGTALANGITFVVTANGGLKYEIPLSNNEIITTNAGSGDGTKGKIIAWKAVVM